MRKGRQPTVLTTLVFTDIVSSTAMAEEMGDRRWRELLDRHYAVIRRELREHGGKELDTRATASSRASTRRPRRSAGRVPWWTESASSGSSCGSASHIGEVELLQGKLSGFNVHAAAERWARRERARSS